MTWARATDSRIVWVIEKGSPAQYFAGFDYGAGKWTPNFDEALKADREQMQRLWDCDKPIFTIFNDDCRISDHMICGGPVTPSHGGQSGTIRGLNCLLNADMPCEALKEAMRARCPGNGDDGDPVLCQSFEASEQSRPCPPGCCVMAEEKDVRSVIEAIEREEGSVTESSIASNAAPQTPESASLGGCAQATAMPADGRGSALDPRRSNVPAGSDPEPSAVAACLERVQTHGIAYFSQEQEDIIVAALRSTLSATAPRSALYKLLADIIAADDMNSGAEPSQSVLDRAIDEARSFLSGLSEPAGPTWAKVGGYSDACDRFGGDGVRVEHEHGFVYRVDEHRQWWAMPLPLFVAAENGNG